MSWSNALLVKKRKRKQMKNIIKVDPSTCTIEEARISALDDYNVASS